MGHMAARTADTSLAVRSVDWFDTDLTEPAQWDAFGSPVNKTASRDPDWIRFLQASDIAGIGAPGPITYQEWIGPAGRWQELLRRCDEWEARVEAAGRFDPFSMPLDPVRLVPGDIALLRWTTAGGVVAACAPALSSWEQLPARDRDPDLPTLVASDIGGAYRAVDATPFFLPGTWPPAMLASEPPDEQTLTQVRLPFGACMCFFDEVPITGLLPVDEGTGRLPTLVALGHQEIPPTEVGLLAVTVFAPPGGVGLEPWFYLSLSVVADDGTTTEKGHMGSWGLMRHSVLGHLGQNLAALLTWGSWDDPVGMPGRLDGLDRGSRPWRRALKTGAVRRAEVKGALDDVRIVELGRLATDSPADGPGAGRTVTTHMRRGHWRRTRVAVRDDHGDPIGPVRGDDAVEGETFEYEPRWIPPTLVNPDAGASADQVYRFR